MTFVENFFPFKDNYKGYKNIDNNTFAESVNDAENFIKNYNFETVVVPPDEFTIENITGVDESETREENEGPTNVGENQASEATNNSSNESDAPNHDPNTSFPTETSR